jgi:alpha-amylase/alpha-mannosidase (GH57 family)
VGIREAWGGVWDPAALSFLLYVNDMARATAELGFVLFADDTNLFAEGQDPAGLFEMVLGGA